MVTMVERGVSSLSDDGDNGGKFVCSLLLSEDGDDGGKEKHIHPTLFDMCFPCCCQMSMMKVERESNGHLRHLHDGFVSSLSLSDDNG